MIAKRHHWPRGAIAICLLFLLTSCSASPTPNANLLLIPSETPTTAPTDIPAGPIYTLDTRQSILDYVAYGPLGIQFPGTFSLTGNTVQFVPDGDAYRAKVDLMIDGNSVTAVNDLVKNALKGNLEVDKYPFGYCIAASKETVTLGDVPIKMTVSGTLELHGRKRDFELPITMTVKDGKLSASGETTLDLLDYQINVPTAIMNSKIKFKATIIATLSTPATATAAATPN